MLGLAQSHWDVQLPLHNLHTTSRSHLVDCRPVEQRQLELHCIIPTDVRTVDQYQLKIPEVHCLQAMCDSAVYLTRQCS